VSAAVHDQPSEDVDDQVTLATGVQRSDKYCGAMETLSYLHLKIELKGIRNSKRAQYIHLQSKWQIKPESRS